MNVTSHRPDDRMISVHAATLTERNSTERRSRVDPPKVAAQSPLHELLIDEVAASVPPAIAQRLRQATTVCAAQDWIAVGAMYQWIKSDSELAHQFVEQVGERPGEAGKALAETIARTLDPPPPHPLAPLLDRCGLVLEAILALGVLALRGIVLTFFLGLASTPSPSYDVSSIVRQALFPEVAYSSWSVETLPLAAFGVTVASCWLFLELLFVPRMLEAVRSAPLRRLMCRAQVNWRPDALLGFWVLHLVGMLSVLAVSCALGALATRPSLFVNPLGAVSVFSCLLFTLAAIGAVFARNLSPKPNAH